jgi:hypothetical protein
VCEPAFKPDQTRPLPARWASLLGELRGEVWKGSMASAGVTAGNAALDELIKEMNSTKRELNDVKEEIKRLKERLVNNDYDGDTRYSSAEKVERALDRLQDKEVELLKTKNFLLQQQQSGAGMSMLPVRQEVVMFPYQRSRCMLANIAAFRLRLGLCWLCCSA